MKEFLRIMQEWQQKSILTKSIRNMFVSKKGKSGKVFEYFNQEMKSFTEDKTLTKEKKNGEENY